ncbi:MAG TPA: PEP-CTERM sorting domain-containing protein [Pirellulales bacterium]|jgi:autotransporter-associated beta strand protein|nr:PEP-CTERM sorting domain-containing protein [Pirellulales bacterium]
MKTIMASCVPLLAIIIAIESLASTASAQSLIPFVANATNNATVQPTGPRAAPNGQLFLDTEGDDSDPTNFSSFAVIDFNLASFQLGGSPFVNVSSVTLQLTENDAAFSNPGTISVYQTNATGVDISANNTSLKYQVGNNGAAAVDPSLLPLSNELGSAPFTTTGNPTNPSLNGTVHTISLTFSNSDGSLTAFKSALNSGGSLRLVITPDTHDTAATFSGFNNTTFPGLSLSFTGSLAGANWDTNGGTAGLGGTGIWDNSSSNFNDHADGTGTLHAYDPSSLVIFGGTAGTVTIAAGSGFGVVENGGLLIASNGYIFQGDTTNSTTINNTALKLGAVSAGVPASILIPTSNVTATINAKVTGTNGLTLAGAGTLVLGSTSNDFTGGVTLSGGTLSVSSDANLGDVSNGIILNGGALKSTASSLSLNSNRVLSGSGGGLDVAPNSTLTVNSLTNMGGALSLTNSGTVSLAASGTNVLAGIAIAAGGRLTVAGNVNFGNTSGQSINVGSGSLLTINGNVTAGLKLTINGPGTVDMQGNNSTINLAGVSNGNLQIGSGGSPGPLVKVHNSTSLGHGASFAQVYNFFNSGTLYADAASPITIDNTVRLSLGSTGATSANPAIFDGDTNLTFNGTVALFESTSSTNPMRIAVNNTTSFNGGWTPPFVAGTFTNPNVILSGNGTLNLAGTLSEELPVTVDKLKVNVNSSMSNNAASFTIIDSGKVTGGVDNALATGSSLTLGESVNHTGGTYATGGHNQTLNTLSLQANSTIDLGGSGSLTFSGGSAGGWNSGTVLRISNWVPNSGNPTGASAVTPLLIGSSDALTSAEKSSIHFTGYLSGAKQVLGTGEILPAFTTTLLLGDLNQDHHFDAADIRLIEEALTNPSQYFTDIHNSTGETTFGLADLLDVADVNHDGLVTNADLQYMLAALKTGHGSLENVPEPSTILLLGLAFPALAAAARRKGKRA